MPTLARYRSMRDFSRTAEPRGKPLPKAEPGFSFVVQKHAARRLHYDFRLELDGVLLSWAVPKGPSLDPSVKRLAMEVEPHPLEYGGFEGTIPQGEYGAGTVMVWDRGTWTPEGDPRRALEKGHLNFTLHGEKLHGAWHLVRTKRLADDGHGNERGKGWLLFKSKDDAAKAGDGLLEAKSNSVLSGRNLEQIAAGRAPRKQSPSPAPRKRGKRPMSKLPATIEPELATLVDAAPTGDDWIHEIKLDGYRILARLERRNVTLLTRNGKDWSDRMPTLRAALAELDVDGAFIDGELVALNEKGVSDFQALQNSLKDGRDDALVYYAFDLLFDGETDLRPRPLLERKSRLRELLDGTSKELSGRVRFSAHVVGQGPQFFENAAKLGLEGTIAKRAQSAYQSGRGRDWLKVKAGQRQEFTIVGYTEPAGSRSHFGALLLGTRQNGELTYAGKVGTGFSQASLADLSKRLKPLVQPKPSVVNPPKGAEARGVTWVKPTLVAEVGYTELTHEGYVRHPTFQGLRDDKPAREVRLETAEHATPKKRVAELRTSRARAGSGASSYPLTNPDKVLYPEQGITKREVLEYYELVAPRMLPQVANRPLTLVRCPNGYDKQGFFQKHPGKAKLPGMREVAIREKEGKSPYSVIDDELGLFSLVQLGALEIHTWGSRADDFEHPDILVFDLDPDPSVGYRAVIDAALTIRGVFEHAKLETFVKTTGGKGLHVVVPLTPKHTWATIKPFTKAIAQSMAHDYPDRYIAMASKAARKGKIFVDYLRNDLTATAVAPYSVRAREAAGVATPLFWDELSVKLKPSGYNIGTIAERLAQLKSDPWADFLTTRQTISEDILTALRIDIHN